MSQPKEMTVRGLSEPRNESSAIEMAEFLAEIEATPPEHRPYLFKIIRLFRESVTQNLSVSLNNEPQVKRREILASDLRETDIQESPKEASKLQDVVLYTDGACQGNPGPGGYGVVLIHGDRREELSGGFQLTTNNRMEMMAAIVGLQVLEKKSKVTLYSDSKYLVDAIEKGWAERWQANGWKRNKKESAMNPDLWEQLLTLCSRHQVKFVWVRGHAGNRENERCDRLAVQASQLRNLPPDVGYENPPMQQISLF
ncbi:MAG: ribonuclease HI [Lyngbya sp.]|nr:ribonuclease HI [Lyngbya sp.]